MGAIKLAAVVTTLFAVVVQCVCSTLIHSPPEWRVQVTSDVSSFAQSVLANEPNFPAPIAEPLEVVAKLLQPVLVWADIVFLAPTPTVICDASSLEITGISPATRSDLVSGVVLIFNRAEYTALGCPSPFNPSAGSANDDKIFRRIVSATEDISGSTFVTTVFVSGHDVIPAIKVYRLNKPHWAGGPPPTGGPVDPQTSRMLTTTMVNETTTANSAARPSWTGAEYSMSGTTELVASQPGASQVEWKTWASSSLEEFGFFRSSSAVGIEWESLIYMEAHSKVDIGNFGVIFTDGTSDEGFVSMSGVSFWLAIPLPNFPWPSAGEPQFGTSSALHATIYGDTQIQGAILDAGFRGGVRERRHYQIRLGTNSPAYTFTLMPGPSGGFTVLSSFYLNPAQFAPYELNGNTGVRPSIQAKIDLLGNALNVGVGFALNAKLYIDTEGMYPIPEVYEPISTGALMFLGSCDRCHEVQGHVQIMGKDLTLEMSGAVSTTEILYEQLWDKFFLMIWCNIGVNYPCP